MFIPIQELLPKAISALGVKKEFDAAIVCERFRKIAPEVIHPEVLHYTYAKSFQRKILTIAVESPAWGQKILESKDSLLKALNTSLGSNQVAELKTRVVASISQQEAPAECAVDEY